MERVAGQELWLQRGNEVQEGKWQALHRLDPRYITDNSVQCLQLLRS